MIELMLIRRYFAPTYTIGKLYVDGIYLCDTLEDVVRKFGVNGEGKVYGKTAIPSGSYQVVITYSPHFKRQLPELLHVPYFQNIRFHAGNTIKDTLGCILVGENKIKGQVINSRKCEALLMSKLKGEKRIKITIK